MRSFSLISMVTLVLSFFTLAQAQRGDKGECSQSSDCISGLCATDSSSTAGGRCRGSGNAGEACLVTKAGSCKAGACVAPNANAAQGSCP